MSHNKVACFIKSVADANARADERWKERFERPGFNWQKAVCCPIFAVEALVNWARKNCDD